MNVETPTIKKDAAAPTAEATEKDAVDELVRRAREAQSVVARMTDEKLDEVILALVRRFRRDLSDFVRRELEATRIGNVPDKEHKLNLVLTKVFNGLHGLKTMGRIGGGQSTVEYAAPVGTVFAVCPLTNPVPNSLFKTLHCIKARNALIASYPRAAEALGTYTVGVIQDVLAEHGLPPALIQQSTGASRAKTQLLMTHPGVDLILATGGNSLVRAAMSSGTPAFGVGAGNVPVLVGETADVDRVAADVVQGKAYDNGIVCGSESNLIAHRAIRDGLARALEAHGAAVLDAAEAARAVETLFDAETGRVDRRFIGVTGADLAEAAGIARDFDVRLIVIPAEEGTNDFLSREKMAPILILYTVEDGTAGIDMAVRQLEDEGTGHTAVVHSEDPVEIDAFAAAVPAGRVLVNTPATHGMLGETTDILVSFMQGSGTWGGNISTEPIGWRHFVNVKTLAFDRR